MNCSIIICTYNRAESLKHTINSVLHQTYEPGKLEVLVVDNGSADHTRQVAELAMNNGNYPVRYVLEAKPGLSHARNCGIKHARGDIILFIDDDALPFSKKWAANLVSAYSDPQVCVAGGDLAPRWPNCKRPEWLHDLLIPPLGITNFGFKEVTELHYPHYPWGANISYRKESVQQLNGFSTGLGWTSDRQLISGEETELNIRLERTGQKILYMPDAGVQHIIPPEKLTKGWLMKRAFAQGFSDAYIDMLSASTLHILFTLVRKSANVALHLWGMLYYSIRRHRRMKLFCEYNLRLAGSYIMRIIKM